jgi:hypothetical protein
MRPQCQALRERNANNLAWIVAEIKIPVCQPNTDFLVGVLLIFL